MGDVPKLDIECATNTEMTVGLGEPATTTMGPAIGSAIFMPPWAFACGWARRREVPS